MYLLIAIGLALAYAILKPLSDGLLDTSKWVAKLFAPADADSHGSSATRLLLLGQAALMDGWLSNVPFITTILFFLSIIFGFVHNWWWGGILVFFVSVNLGVLAKLVWTRPVSHYLHFLHHKMVNRAADYKAKNDLERSNACELYCSHLQRMIVLYQGSGLRPPTPKQLNAIPYGDLYAWLNRGTSERRLT